LSRSVISPILLDAILACINRHHLGLIYLPAGCYQDFLHHFVPVVDCHFVAGADDAAVCGCFLLLLMVWHITRSGPAVFNFCCTDFIFYRSDYIFNSAIYRVTEDLLGHP